ncbi:hypothetical protein ACSSS7_003659 [Eimeria intestinalis]
MENHLFTGFKGSLVVWAQARRRLVLAPDLPLHWTVSIRRLSASASCGCVEDDNNPSLRSGEAMASLSRFSSSVRSPASEPEDEDAFGWARTTLSGNMLSANDEVGLMELEWEHEFAATRTTAESISTDAPEVDHAAVRAASLLTRAAKRIELYQAEQRRLRLQQRRPHPGEEEAHSARQDPSSACSPTLSCNHNLWKTPSDRVSASGAAATNASASAGPKWHFRQAEAGVALRDHSAASVRFSGIHSRWYAECASMSPVRKESDLTARLSVRFRDPEATAAASPQKSHSRQTWLHQEDEFARRLQVIQRRHLRKLQRQQQQHQRQQHQEQQQQQQQQQQPQGIEARRAGQGACTGPDTTHSSETRSFTQHGLRRKTAALFKDAVRRGVLSGPTAEKVKEEIESGLYEAPSRRAMEEAELRECTFKPQINSHVSLVKRDKVPWWERLHAEAQRILESQEEENTLGKLHAAKSTGSGGKKRVEFAAEGAFPGMNFSSRCRGVAAEGGSRPAASAPVSSSLLLSLQLQPSHGTRLVPEKQSCTDTSGRKQTKQGMFTPTSPETALTGRALLQRYLGSEAPQWLRLAGEQSHVN